MVAFQRVVNSPRRGIGDTTQARIAGHANTIGEAIWDVAAKPEEIPGLGAAAIKAVDRFMSVMERLRERADGGAPVGDLLEEALTETGYTDALKAERTIEAEGRLENLEELVSVAREYDAQADEPSVEEFLQQIALFSEQDNLTDEEGIVTLMTLHNAKGLEYPVVFIIGMEDGVFPHMRSIEAGDIEEERRLCYVGITRAMRNLYLTHARTRAMYGGREWNVPSRFLEEIPAELTDQEDAGGSVDHLVERDRRGRGRSGAAQRGRHVQRRGGRRARGLRRGRRHRRRAGRRRRRALPRRRLGAQADGRLRAAQEGMSAKIIDGKAVSERVREGVRQEVDQLGRGGQPGARARDDPRRRRPGVARSTCATSARRARPRACARSTTSSPRTRARTRSRR